MSKEFRLGNFVTINSPDWDALYEIIEIRQTDVVIHNKRNFDEIGKQQYHNVYGIKLTENWLKNFGFTKDEYLFSKGIYHYDVETKIFYIGNDHISGGHGDANIYYVHQLQNLYFALKGDELEFVR